MSVNMTKGQKISLSKNGSLRTVRMGLGWDAAKSFFGGEKDIDLDASCVMLDENRRAVDIVWYGQLHSRDGSITHTGDNLTGKGDGDDESIIVDLSRIPLNVKTLSFTVNSYSSQGFSDVKNAFCRLIDETTGNEIARFDLSAQGSHTALVMANVYNRNGEWKMAALGETGNGRTVNDILPLVSSLA